MGRPKSPTQIEEGYDYGAQEVEATNEQNLIELTFADIKDASAKAKFYRKGKHNKYAFLAEYLVDEWSLNGFKEEWGGGEYSFQIFDSEGKFNKRGKFSIDATLKPKVDAEILAAAKANGDKSGENLLELFKVMNDKNDNSSIVAMMQESNKQTMQMMMLMMQESQKQNATMMSGMMQIFALMNQGHKQEDNFDKILKFKMIFDGSNDKMLTMFREGMNLGSNQKDPPWYEKLIECMAPAVPAVVGALATGGKVNVLPPTPSNPNPQDDMLLKVAAIAQQLEKSAESKQDVVEVADYMYDHFEKMGKLDVCLKFIEDDKWYDNLLAFSPPQGKALIEKHKDYLHQVREELISTEEVDETDSANGSD